MFSYPKGIDFRCLQTYQGSGVNDAMDKLKILTKVQTDEILKVANDQYKDVCLESSNKLKVNSVVLLKNIANEGKWETMKLARVKEIKESIDGSQRVVTVTYTNVGVNKKGNWIGTPVTVERWVKDLILVDAALDDSTLSPKINAADKKGST